MIEDVLIFTRSLGLNDNGRQATVKADPRSGKTEIIDCLNVTTAEDGTLESIHGLTTAITHTVPVLSLSAGKRFLFQSATETKEWDGTNVTARFPLKTGAMVHTPIDCRVGLFKSPDTTLTMQAATVGTNPNPATAQTYSAMPAYNKAFLLNSRLYAVNTADPRFLQYSEDYHYDLWSIGDGYIGHQFPIIAAGAINPVRPLVSGVILLMHANGVTVYTGSGPRDFIKSFYPCLPLAGTLFSGFISKSLGSGHVFLCQDGIYVVDAEGVIARLSGDQLNHLSSLNTSYAGAIVEAGKYLALGNTVCLEYDFRSKATAKRSPQGMVAATLWNGVGYFAAGSLIQKHSGLSLLPTSVTFPHSTLGAAGRKSFIDLFLTGRFDGVTTITATGEEGKSWTMTIPALGTVSNRRINNVPKVFLGNRISLKISTASGAFRLEALRATINVSQRAR